MNTKMFNYEFIRNDGIDHAEFRQRVSDMRALGWECVGGIAIDKEGRLYQALQAPMIEVTGPDDSSRVFQRTV